MAEEYETEATQMLLMHYLMYWNGVTNSLTSGSGGNFRQSSLSVGQSLANNFGLGSGRTLVLVNEDDLLVQHHLLDQVVVVMLLISTTFHLK